jgi:hypothetical protein
MMCEANIFDAILLAEEDVDGRGTVTIVDVDGIIITCRN